MLFCFFVGGIIAFSLELLTGDDSRGMRLSADEYSRINAHVADLTRYSRIRRMISSAHERKDCIDDETKEYIRKLNVVINEIGFVDKISEEYIMNYPGGTSLTSKCYEDHVDVCYRIDAAATLIMLYDARLREREWHNGINIDILTRGLCNCTSQNEFEDKAIRIARYIDAKLRSRLSELGFVGAQYVHLVQLAPIRYKDDINGLNRIDACGVDIQNATYIKGVAYRINLSINHFVSTNNRIKLFKDSHELEEYIKQLEANKL